jgi:hypothetical protein
LGEFKETLEKKRRFRPEIIVPFDEGEQIGAAAVQENETVTFCGS